MGLISKKFGFWINVTMVILSVLILWFWETKFGGLGSSVWCFRFGRTRVSIDSRGPVLRNLNFCYETDINFIHPKTPKPQNPKTP